VKIDYYYLVTSKENQGVIYNEGIALLASLAKKGGADVSVQVLDLADVRNGNVKYREADYHALGFASLQFPLAKLLVREIAGRKTGGKIVAGGIHATVARESLIQVPELDAVVSGEGEPFIEWLVSSSGGDLAGCNLSNVYVKGRPPAPLVHTEPVDVNSLPFPDRRPFGIEKIARFPEFIFSRGCPYSCKYCANEFLNGNFGRKIRRKTPDYAVEEVKKVVSDCGVAADTMLTFHDDIFISQTKWLVEFAGRYTSEVGNAFRCNTTASMLNEEKAGILKEMNCGEIWIGVEVGNERFRREVLGKKITNEQVIRAFGISKRYGLNSVAFILLGVSGEKRRHILDTMRLCRRIQPTYLTVAVFIPFPGTSLYEMEKKNGNLREIDEASGDKGVAFSGLKRKSVSDFEYSIYAQLLRYYTDRKTFVFLMLMVYKLPVFALIRPVLKKIIAPLRDRLLPKYIVNKRNQ